MRVRDTGFLGMPLAQIVSQTMISHTAFVKDIRMIALAHRLSDFLYMRGFIIDVRHSHNELTYQCGGVD
jgi:hypothetical protein